MDTNEFDSVSRSEVIDGLNDLLQLDHDAVGAYEVAIDKLEDRQAAERIREFKGDHQRHIEELNRVLAGLGGTAENEPHATGPFKQGLQSLGGLAGDKGLLMAWRTNELQVRSKYQNYASDASAWPADARDLVQRNAQDEERHYRWVVEKLERMGVGSAEEGGGMGGDVREKVRQAAEGTRDQVAGGLEAVADRIGGLADHGGAAAGVATRVAGGLQTTARGVREGDVSNARDQLEARVRESPAQTLLIAAGAGFVLGRLIR